VRQHPGPSSTQQPLGVAMGKSEFTPKETLRERRCFTAEEVRNRLDYDPETGIFRWKVRVMCFGGGRFHGDEAGTLKDGYKIIILFGRQYRAHHLAWLLMTGEWPPSDMDVDHKNRIRNDNRWTNLRIASRAQNNLNTRTFRKSRSGHRGVHKNRANGWFARISVEKRVIHLGCFATLPEAIAARREAELKHYGQFI